ncbi:MAG TPA: hypothetical protein VFK30_12265, partial [Anaerolineae bacterium]|nr:hypothetical protein [Anaerolineae bacterium]
LGIPFGVLMLIKYVRSGSTDEALISALCLSPYLALPSWLMLVPWAARTSIRTVIAVIVVWACLLFWHIGGDLYANTIVGALSIIAAVWLGIRMIKEAREKQMLINPVR